MSTAAGMPLVAGLAAALLAFATPASATEVARSPVGPGAAACRVATGPVEAMTCDGAGGWQIAIGYPAIGATLAFRHDRHPVAFSGPALPPLEGVGGRGLRAEWKGARPGTRFQPRSVIVPATVLHADDRRHLVENGEPPASPRRAPVLLVFLLDDRQACLVAIVDRSVNANATALARTAAAGASTCPGQAGILGRRSAALASLVGEPGQR